MTDIRWALSSPWHSGGQIRSTPQRSIAVLASDGAWVNSLGTRTFCCPVISENASTATRFTLYSHKEFHMGSISDLLAQSQSLAAFKYLLGVLGGAFGS